MESGLWFGKPRQHDNNRGCDWSVGRIGSVSVAGRQIWPPCCNVHKRHCISYLLHLSSHSPLVQRVCYLKISPWSVWSGNIVKCNLGDGGVLLGFIFLWGGGSCVGVGGGLLSVKVHVIMYIRMKGN